MNNLSELQKYLKDKNICLLGNARSILNTPKNIDKYDIVIRMNRGLPRDKERYIGKKTDVLCLSTNLSDSMVLQFHTRYILWITNKYKEAVTGWQQGALQNPPEDWREIRDQYPKDKLPSTGCIVINFLLKHIEFKSLTIYGFDFFKTGTHYHNLKTQNWHCCEFEEKLIKDMIKNHPNVELISE
jgi:hypothetical protein